MKNKGFTYLLLIIVAVVWYNVFFRIKSNLSTEQATFASNNMNIHSFPSTKKDTFSLKANYGDPFGFTRVDEGSNEIPLVQSTSIQTPPPLPTQPKKVYWPQIEYKGLIKKSSSKHPLCLLKVDGEFFNLLKGDYFLDDIYLKEVNKDYVEITYQKEVKIIYLR